MEKLTFAIATIGVCLSASAQLNAASDSCKLVAMQAMFVMQDRQEGRSKAWILDDRGANDASNPFASSTSEFVNLAFEMPMQSTVQGKEGAIKSFGIMALAACES